MSAVFKFASFTTINVDSASPECSVKGLGYKEKWFFGQLLPIVFAVLLLLVYCVQRVVAWVKWKYTSPPAPSAAERVPLAGKSHASLVSLYLGALNLLYVFLIQKALEVHRVRANPSPCVL